MANSDYILVIGSVDCNDGVNTTLLSDNLSLGAPHRIREQLGGPGVDIAAAGPLDESAWVPAHWQVLFQDTSVDGLVARVAALAAELRDLSAITVGLKGSAYTGTITPKNAECVEIPLAGSRAVSIWSEFRTVVEIIVEREAPIRSAAETLYSASALSVPGVLDLSPMTGTMKSPLNVALNAATANLHQIVAGVYPDAPQPITKFVLKAATLTWSAGAAAADANGWPDGVGNTVWKTNAAAGVYTDIDVSDYLPGTYALYANVCRDAGASPASIGTPYGTVDIEGTDLRRQFVGLVSLPCAVVRGSAASTLRVTLCGDGTDYAYVNTIEIVPVSWGAFSWHHGTAASSCDELRLEDGIVYADNVASPVYVTLGNELRVLGGTLVITGEGTAEAPTLDVEVTL